MKTISRFLISASMALALAFTFSCSSGDDEGDPSNGGGGSCDIGNKTKKIGSQTWMTENLNCDVGNSKCYGNDPANCVRYGRLYDWETAKTVCPSGWHLPSADDWDILMEYVQTDNGSTYTPGSGASIAGKYLKAASGWNDDYRGQSGNGEDKYGFAALPGGYGNFDDSFNDAGNNGYWWSATEYSSYIAYSRLLYHVSYASQQNGNGKSALLSVRCVQD